MGFSTGSVSLPDQGRDPTTVDSVRDEIDDLMDDGFFLRREALGAGWHDRDLLKAVRCGVLVRLRQGAYADAAAVRELDPVARHALTGRAVVRAAHAEVVLSHLSSLAQLGAPLWDLPLAQVHITRANGRSGRREAGVVPHGAVLAERDVHHVGRTPITVPALAAVELSTITDVEHTLPVLDWVLHAELATRPDLLAYAEQLNQRPGSLASRIAIGLADGAAESVGESRTRYMCWRAGLPEPVPNYVVRDRWGRVVARVDLAWPEHGVFLEFDGKFKYQRYRRPGESVADVVVREKRREELICGLTGWRCIRLVWAHLHQPRATTAWIRSVLDGAPVYDNRLRPAI